MKKQSLKVGLIGGGFYSIMMIVMSRNYSFENILKWVIIGLVFSIIIGFVMPFLFGKLVPKMSKTIKTPILEEYEIIIMNDAANHYKGKFNAIGGKLFLTNRRLIFSSHRFNIPNEEFSIPLESIKETMEKKNNSNNGLRIITNNDLIFDFVVNNRENWLENLKK